MHPNLNRTLVNGTAFWLQLSALIVTTSIGCAQNNVSTTVIKTSGASENTKGEATNTISPLLRGTQYTYYNTAIKARITDKELLGSWKEASISAMRYPGGTSGDHYIWDQPSSSYFSSKTNNANTIVKPEEFVQACRTIGAEPIFQVNALNKKVDGGYRHLNPTKIEDIRSGAKWAAGWVKQTNIEKGWNIKYWEIGNELWIMLWPEEYATIVAEYSKAMKAVDPSIKIIACGLSHKVGPFGGAWYVMPDDPNWKMRLGHTNDPESWNKALFTIAKGHFDYLAPHPYIGASKTEDPREIYLQTVAKVSEQSDLKNQYEILERYKSPVRLAITEWATNFSYSVPVKRLPNGNYRHYFYTLGNGINIAHYYGQIIAGGKTDLAIMHEVADTQTLYLWPKKAMADKPLSHPAFLGFKLWNSHLGTRALPMETAGEPRISIGEKTYSALFNFASEDDKNYYLVAINLDPDAPHQVKWQPEGKLLPLQGQMSLLAGPELKSDNWDGWNKPEQLISIKESEVAATNGAYSFTLPPHSMAGITIPKVP